MAVYKDYRAMYAKGDFSRTVRFLTAKDQELIGKMTATYAAYRGWVTQYKATIEKMINAPELMKAYIDFAELGDDGKVLSFYMRIATITGKGEPKELPSGVEINGDTAELKFPEGQTRSMVKEDGKWMVSLPPDMKQDLDNSIKQLENTISLPPKP